MPPWSRTPAPTGWYALYHPVGAFMTAAVTASRHDAGNIEYEAHQVEGQPGTFVVFERWESRGALEGHLGAPRMRELVPRLLELMDGTVEDGIRFLQPFRPER